MGARKIPPIGQLSELMHFQTIQYGADCGSAQMWSSGTGGAPNPAGTEMFL
jgi:hypothetical protein